MLAVQWVCSCFLFGKRSGKRILKVNESISFLTFLCFELEFLNLSILGEVLMKLLLSSGRGEVFDVKTFLILLYVFVLFSQYLLLPFFLRKSFLDVDLMSFIGSSMFLFNCVESPLWATLFVIGVPVADKGELRLSICARLGSITNFKGLNLSVFSKNVSKFIFSPAPRKILYVDIVESSLDLLSILKAN